MLYIDVIWHAFKDIIVPGLDWILDVLDTENNEASCWETFFYWWAFWGIRAISSRTDYDVFSNLDYDSLQENDVRWYL